MGKPTIRPPSRVDSLSFPVFGITWFGTPSPPPGMSSGPSSATNHLHTNASNYSAPSPSAAQNIGISLIAYCGGGGSAKTGVGNKLIVDITADDCGASGSSSVSRQIEISTGEALCFGIHAFRPPRDEWGMVRLVAAVGDEVLIYGIPIFREGELQGGDLDADVDFRKEEAILLGKTNVGQGYGAGVVTYTSLNQTVAVGCENGIVVVYHLKEEQGMDGTRTINFQKIIECQGHTKAICSLSFHPQGRHILSSAKDGTARVFCAETGSPLAVMECEVHDPNGPSPPKPANNANATTTKDPRMMKRPPQILVRGCSYGDLEGRTIYTVASGKRGAAYLTKWKVLVPLNAASGAGGTAGGPPNGGGPNDDNIKSGSGGALNIRNEYRVQCSPVPISAVSLSSDFRIFALGSVEGTISLYDVQSQKVLKQFQGHDLPVTCMASRPVDSILPLPGEEVEAIDGGVSFDALSASADNRLGRWTLQKKSRKVVPKSSSRRRNPSAIESFLWNIFRIPLLLTIVIAAVAVRDVFNICGEEVNFSALMMDMNAATKCVYREVLWADETRTGVHFVPE
mmetsp:Transcript_18000/g.36849  ORF Transcript_18000/g.36849 Transcript_18000/m.36849 type:complete len:569 (-) Transcript_18000:34-1740(-)